MLAHGSLWRSLVVSIALLALGCARASIAAEPQPDDAATAKPLEKYPFGDVSAWLPGVKSFHLKAEVLDKRSAEVIARNLRQIRERNPKVQDPDPRNHPELRAESHISVTCDFDRARLRSEVFYYDSQDKKRARVVHLWDGSREVYRETHLNNKESNIKLSRQPDSVGRSLFGFLTYLSTQPPEFWWNNSPEARRDFEKSQGTPADYILVDREVYHGVDCNVYLSSVGNQSDRYYMGVADERWYGAKVGIIVLPDHAELLRVYRIWGQKLLGMQIAEHLTQEEMNKLMAALRTLPQKKKQEWCRFFYWRVARRFTPVFEYWFSDFRDVGEGRYFPYEQHLLFYEHEGETTFVGTTRTLTVKELVFDRPLDDELFREEPREGDLIVDHTHEPSLFYKHKAKFTPKEWDAILRDGQDRAARMNAGKK